MTDSPPLEEVEAIRAAWEWFQMAAAGAPGEQTWEKAEAMEDQFTTALDSLLARLEAAERERDEARERAIPPHWAAIFARAEVAEAENERLREALDTCFDTAGGTTGSTVRSIVRAALAARTEEQA